MKHTGMNLTKEVETLYPKTIKHCVTGFIYFLET